MIARSYTVAFEGVEARLVEVQCAVAPGVPGFSIVGLPDKAVNEARDRVRAAFAELQIALPSRKITVNLSPADLPKQGSHFDLPLALTILGAINVVPAEVIEGIVSLGELSLQGVLQPVAGVLPATVTAASQGLSLVCPQASGPEAAWIDAATVLAPRSLHQLIGHLTGKTPLPAAVAGELRTDPSGGDIAQVRGQERGKRALEISAAGRHHMLMMGPPGAGKSMLADCIPGLLPELSPAEALETSMVHSLGGVLKGGGIQRTRPFRDPHHSASRAAIVGGGRNALPGEISLAHNGVLFLDELPEFSRDVLETLRQPLETGQVMIARANAHLRYPARFLLLAAANPCRCGYLGDPDRACNRAPGCGADYLGRISGPLQDRFDLRVEMPPVPYTDLDGPLLGEAASVIAARVRQARTVQSRRYADCAGVSVNADADGALLREVAAPDQEGRDLLARVADRFGLSARGYHRVLRVARTIADLAGSEQVRRPHLAEAVSYRLTISDEV